MRDQPVHQIAGVRWVRDDSVSRAVMIKFQRILAGPDIASIDTPQTKPFEMAHQVPVAGTGLGEGTDAVQVRNQRHHRCPWRRVEISLTALEVGSLTHRGVRFCYPVAPCLTAPVLPAVCNPPYASRSFRRLSLPLAGATREIVLNDNCPSASRNRHDKAAS